MANLYFTTLVFLIFEKASSINKISLKCTPEFCDEYVQRFPCPPLDPGCSNPNISIVIPSTTVCNCCEHCFIFKGKKLYVYKTPDKTFRKCTKKANTYLGEDCVIGHIGQPLPKVICKPGTICRAGKCVMMTAPDPDFHKGYECENGKCHCAVIVNNEIKRIFGSFNVTNDLTKEKQCGCSISGYYANQSTNKLFSIPNAFLPIPRCLSNGQYDPLQCIDNMCGCVNRTTGAWDLTTKKVSISALAPGNPKCFDQKRHKIGQYYTTCEKERNALMLDITLQDLREINILLAHKVQCTPDGEYATTETYN